MFTALKTECRSRLVTHQVAPVSLHRHSTGIRQVQPLTRPVYSVLLHDARGDLYVTGLGCLPMQRSIYSDAKN
jgi:hypothetical protein